MLRKGNTLKIILVVILVISMFTLMHYTGFGRVGVSPMESVLKDTLAPLQGLAMNLGHRLRGLVSFPFDLIGMADENQLMKEKINELEGSIRRYEELKLENDRLRSMLDFKSEIAPKIGYEVTAAAVIGRNPSNMFGLVTINKGTEEGLSPNMTVICNQGLVGRITTVSSDTAEVLLITDPRSGVAALIQESRFQGIVEGLAGSPGQVRMVHIPLEAEISRGQSVVTSGTGSIYPKGIPIGWVRDFGREPSGLFSNAIIVPFVDFSRLEEVMVINGVRTPAGAPVENGEINVANLPYPWGEGRTDLRGRSPAAVRAGEG